jgi:hypothetical protein
MSRKNHRGEMDLALKDYEGKCKVSARANPPQPPLEKGGVAYRWNVSPPFLKGDLGGFGDLRGEP